MKAALRRMNSVSNAPPAKCPTVVEEVPYTDERYARLKLLASTYDERNLIDRTTVAYKFWQKTDWDALKDEFYVSVDARGGYKYRSVAEFAAEKFKKAHEREWVLLAIGPYPSKRVPWKGSWTLERHNEHWRADKRTNVLAKALEKQADAATISYSLASYYIDEMSKLKTWLDELMEYSGHELFKRVKPGASKGVREEAKKEMRFILAAQQKLLNLMDQVRTSVQTSVGGPNAVVATLAAQVFRDQLKSPLNAGRPDNVRHLITQMTEVAIARSELYKTSLPNLEAIDVEPVHKKPM
jgi:hypothetical protein